MTDEFGTRVDHGLRHLAPKGGEFARSWLSELSKEDLIDMVLSQQHDAGVRLNFSGRNEAARLARKVQPRSSRKVGSLCIGTEVDQARNQVIEGENLQAMVTLFREKGHVDLILTDPPYNTGKDFRYNDRWEEDPNDPDLGELVSEDEPGRHTKWMRFMLPRLRIMKAMLKPSGVLAICIDHRELFRLGQMLDELFHQTNRLAIINWKRASTLRNDKEGVSTATEYVLVYAKNLELAPSARLNRTEAHDEGYKNRDGDPEGDWMGVGPFAPGASTHKGMVYAIQHPFTGKLVYPTGDQCWKKEKRTIKTWLEAWGSQYAEVDLGDGCAKALLLRGAKDPRGSDPLSDPVVQQARERAQRVQMGVLPPLFFTKGGEGQPREKTYLKNVQRGVVPSTYWADEDYDEPVELGSTSWSSDQSGTSEAGSRELAKIVGQGHGFETVKPLRLFTKIVQLWCPPNGLVLDPFAGSGTTGHAVLHLNKETGANRRFILIEQGRPERGDPFARSLTVQRLRRVIDGDWASGPASPLGGGFRFVALRDKVDAKALLNMERDEMTDAVIASHFDATRGGGPGLITMTHDGYNYLVARNAEDEGFYLVWRGAREQPVFDKRVYESVVTEARKAGLKPRYHVYARFNLYQSDDVVFYQIPNRILMDFGLSATTDSFNNEPSDTLMSGGVGQ